MRKMFFICCFLITTILSAQSAVSKGIYTVGGSLSYTTVSFENSSQANSTFSVNPVFGYFFLDNFYTAISLDYEHRSYGSIKQDMYGFGPSIRYYAHTEKVVPFIGASYNFYWQDVSSSGGDKATSTELMFTGGLDYFITDYFAIESTINYSLFNFKYPPGFYTNNAVKAWQFKVGIGASYYIH